MTGKCVHFLQAHLGDLKNFAVQQCLLDAQDAVSNALMKQAVCKIVYKQKFENLLPSQENKDHGQ